MNDTGYSLTLKIQKNGVTNLWILHIYTEKQIKKVVNNEIISAYHLNNVIRVPPVLQR